MNEWPLLILETIQELQETPFNSTTALPHMLYDVLLFSTTLQSLIIFS